MSIYVMLILLTMLLVVYLRAELLDCVVCFFPPNESYLQAGLELLCSSILVFYPLKQLVCATTLSYVQFVCLFVFEVSNYRRMETQIFKDGKVLGKLALTLLASRKQQLKNSYQFEDWPYIYHIYITAISNVTFHLTGPKPYGVFTILVSQMKGLRTCLILSLVMYGRL